MDKFLFCRGKPFIILRCCVWYFNTNSLHETWTTFIIFMIFRFLDLGSASETLQNLGDYWDRVRERGREEGGSEIFFLRGQSISWTCLSQQMHYIQTANNAVYHKLECIRTLPRNTSPRGPRDFPRAGILHPEARREIAQGHSQGPRGAKSIGWKPFICDFNMFTDLRGLFFSAHLIWGVFRL